MSDQSQSRVSQARTVWTVVGFAVGGLGGAAAFLQGVMYNSSSGVLLGAAGLGLFLFSVSGLRRAAHAE